MDVDENDASSGSVPARSRTTLSRLGLDRKADSEDEGGDFHEAMLRGEDFDFEWGSESYTSAGAGEDDLHKSILSLKAPSREMSVGLPEAFDIKEDFDALSTPATTPRSPLEDSEIIVCPPSVNACASAATAAGASALGMEVTLCGALSDQVERPESGHQESELLTEPVMVGEHTCEDESDRARSC
jgi:hypothetical protein